MDTPTTPTVSETKAPETTNLPQTPPPTPVNGLNPSEKPSSPVLGDSFEENEQQQESASIIVKNVPVSKDTENSTSKQLNDFFSFCGAINSLSLVEDEADPDVVSALITFENTSAARTALLLNHTVLHEKVITVELAPFNLGAAPKTNSSAPSNAPHVPQASAINKLLAAGYALSATTIEKAQQYDEHHQISAQLNEMSKVVEGKVNAVDQEYKISEKMQAVADQITQIDQQYQISPTIISTVETATNQVHNIDEQYHISETIGQAVQDATTQVMALDDQYKVSENVIAVAEKATAESVRILSNVSEELKLPERTQEAAEAISYGAQQVSQFLQTNETVQGIGSFFSNAIGTVGSAFGSLSVADPAAPVVEDDQPHITIGQPTKYEPVVLVQSQKNETP